MDINKLKICIGIPSAGLIKYRTVSSLLWMTHIFPYDFFFSIKDSCSVIHNRASIVEDARKAECSHILFIDSDMVFADDLLKKLLAHDKDIVGVNAMKRLHDNDQLLDLRTTVTYDGEIPDKLFKCDSVGMGILLVKTSVFDKIEQPWFQWEYDDKNRIRTGEDTWFCKQAKKAGLDIWCDPTAYIKHMGEFLY